MKIVLRNDIARLGKRGDVLDVSDGYARNFLLPSKQAILATKGILDQAAAMRRSREIKDARNRQDAEEIARRLVPMVIKISQRAGSGEKLFGSVTTQDIVSAIKEQANLELDRRKLILEEPIKTLGTHEVLAKLHPEVEFRITLQVEAQ